MFDIGGGSTELMWLDNQSSGGPRTIDILSLPLGVVNLAEEYGRDALPPEAFEAIVERIDADLTPFENRHAIATEIADGNVHVLGTSGTVTSMGAIYLDLVRYDRARVDGLSIRYESIDAICRNLASLDFEALHNHPCIGPGRADLMVMGCAILTAICRRWPATQLTAADRGIREGLLMGMIASGRAVA
jgi:exopolyphosphatase/guanosine-5'-triphosphate,3'-diphosphate pyrophosphatase